MFHRKIHLFHISFAIVILLLNLVPLENYTAFAQVRQPTTVLPPQTIFFTNAYVEPNSLPNKPFQVYVDLQSVNPTQLLVSISAPTGVSITSPVVAKLENTGVGNTVRATWTLVTSKTGTYPVTISAVSNYPIDSQQLNLSVTVGYSQSLMVTKIDVPGSITPNTIFPVKLNLKNILNVQDTDIIAHISVPSGLAILSSPTSSIGSIDPSKEIQFRWNVKAEDVGYYVININYTSAISGPNFATVNVNVGKFGYADISTQSVTLNGIPTIMPSAAPGDKFLPLDARLINTGTVPLYNITAKLLSGNVFDVKTYQNENASSGNAGNVANIQPDIFQIGMLDVGKVIDTLYYVDISNRIAPGTYNSYLSVTYSDGNKPYTKVLAFPVLISDTGVKINSVTLKGITSYPGDISQQIDVQLINTGSYVSNVYTKLALPNQLTPAWGNSTSTYFAQINPFQTVNASYYINVAKDAQPGHHPISMEVTTQKGKTTLPIDFIVSPKAIFIVVSVDASELYPGASNVPVKLMLKNNSTTTANFVTAKLQAGNVLPGVKSSTITTVGNEDNVGTILPGQVFPVTFLVDVDPSSSPGDRSTSIEIDWTQDNAVTPFTQPLLVQGHISEGAPYLLYSGGIPWVYFLIVVGLIIMVIVFSKRRRNRLELVRSSLHDDSNKFSYIEPQERRDDEQDTSRDSG